MFDLIIFAVLMAVTFCWGGMVERKHYASIRQREAALPAIPVIQFERQTFEPEVASVKLIHGSTVVGADYFKHTLSTIVSVFGGNIAVMESVLDRARREAVIRAKTQAPDADYIANLRYETTALSEGRPAVEAYAYATAIYLKK